MAFFWCSYCLLTKFNLPSVGGVDSFLCRELSAVINLAVYFNVSDFLSNVVSGNRGLECSNP